ncbi:formylglycine-generating enzyme family protein, partial [Acidobacteria bacterium AH-259-G07]|nr:formylglycine-generating enzyme family protein [Acidobacteria bacterium AH-259-G07]
WRRNPWGLYNMLGTVAEWCNSRYRLSPYLPDDREESPRLRKKEEVVVRGLLRSADREKQQAKRCSFNVSFRCVIGGDLRRLQTGPSGPRPQELQQP